MEFEKLSVMLLDTTKIAFVVGLLIYLINKVLSPKLFFWLTERPYVTNIFVVVSSIGLSFLGAWLNLLSFQPRVIVEYIYFGLFSAGVNTMGYEFIKNWAKELVRKANNGRYGAMGEEIRSDIK